MNAGRRAFGFMIYDTVFEDCDIITLFKREIQIIDGDQKDDFPLWKVQIKKK